MTLLPTFVDFSADPPRAANATVRFDGAYDAGDHWIVDADGTMVIDFTVDGPIEEATLQVHALVSKLGPVSGHAPLDVMVNAHPVATRLRIPGGGDLPQHLRFAVPGTQLRAGVNTLTLHSGNDASSMLWLYRVLIESVWDRDAAERALLAEHAAQSTFTFAARTLTGDDSAWQPAGTLRFQIDEGQSAIPAELGWRCTDGSEASVSFAREMGTFLGHARTPDGQWRQLSGELVDRRAHPDEPVRRFTTQVSWGNRWHPAGDLTLYLAAGDSPVESVRWRDQRGNSAAIGLTGQGTAFLGYAQRVNEGPIGYRGTALDT